MQVSKILVQFPLTIHTTLQHVQQTNPHTMPRFLYSRAGSTQIYAQLNYGTDVFQEAECKTLSKMSARNQHGGRNF